MDPLSAVLGVGKILGGLFGKKKKDPTPYDNMISQAAGAREAAARYGFNPLTMLQYGNPSGAIGAGGGAPLASTEMILGGLEDVVSEMNGSAARERKQEELRLELAERELENLRTGASGKVRNAGANASVFAGGARAAPAVKSALPQFGLPAADAGGAYTGLGGLVFGNPFNAPVKQNPVDKGPDHIIIQGSDGEEYSIAALNGEPLEWDTAAIAGAQMIPQWAYKKYMKYVGRPFAEAVDKAGREIFAAKPNHRAFQAPFKPWVDPRLPPAEFRSKYQR